jgi:hypothetical protein
MLRGGTGSDARPARLAHSIMAMTIPREELALLARRDARVFTLGSIGGILCFASLFLARVGVMSHKHSAMLVIVISAFVVPACLGWWLAGPRELRSHRYLVLAPLGLISGPLIYSLGEAGAASAALVLSVSFGVGAAIAGGLAIASRRRGAQ